MDAIQITLTGEMRSFVNEQVAAGGFATPEGYVQNLLEAERLRKAEDHLEALLLSGMKGPRIELTTEEWQAMRLEADALIKARKVS